MPVLEQRVGDVGLPRRTLFQREGEVPVLEISPEGDVDQHKKVTVTYGDHDLVHERTYHDGVLQRIRSLRGKKISEAGLVLANVNAAESPTKVVWRKRAPLVNLKQRINNARARHRR